MATAEITPPAAALLGAEAVIFVTDLAASLAFYTDTLGFEVAFVYGEPALLWPGQTRWCAAKPAPCGHEGAGPQRSRREDLLAAAVTVSDADLLFGEFQRAGARLHQMPRIEPWGARTFIVPDPDDNLILFASDRG